MKNVQRYFLSPELLIRENQASNGLQHFLNELIRYVEKPAHSGPSIELVFELAFEAIQRSARHKSGIAVRFPRILRWRTDKPISEADTLETIRALLPEE